MAAPRCGREAHASRTPTCLLALPAHPPKQALPVHGEGVQEGTPCLLQAFSEKLQHWFFFPVIPAVPAGPCGLVLCLESAVAVVLWNVTLVVQVPWGQGGSTRQCDSSNSPHVCSSWWDGTGPDAVRELTAREGSLGFTSRGQRHAAFIVISLNT